MLPGQVNCFLNEKRTYHCQSLITSIATHQIKMVGTVILHLTNGKGILSRIINNEQMLWLRTLEQYTRSSTGNTVPHETLRVTQKDTVLKYLIRFSAEGCERTRHGVPSQEVIVKWHTVHWRVVEERSNCFTLQPSLCMMKYPMIMFFHLELALEVNRTTEACPNL